MTAPPDQLRRPRDLTQLIDTALRLYRRNFGEFLAIAAVTLPISAASAIAGGLIEDEVVGAIVTAILAVPSIAVGLIAEAAIVRAVADVADGVAPDFNSVYGRVLSRLGTLFLTALRALAGILVLCVTIVGIPFAFYLSIRWVFFAQVVMIESKASMDEARLRWLQTPQPRSEFARILARIERRLSSPATSFSAQVVQGSWWRTLGILFLVGLLASFPSGIVTLIFSAAAPVAGNLASAVVAVVVLPFSAAAATLLFFDLQSRERERVSIA